MLTPNTLFGLNSVNIGFIGLDASDIQTYNEKPFSAHHFLIIDGTLYRIFTPITQKRAIRDYIVCFERVKLFVYFITVYFKRKH